MELLETLRRRTMVRNFTGEPIPAEILERVLGAARGAPSAGNAPGWEAVVLAGEKESAPFWEATTTSAWRVASSRWPGLSRASVVVAFFVHPGAYLERYREHDKVASGLGEGEERWPVPYWFVDGGFAALLVLLAATDAGLGACFLGNFRGEEALRAALGVPPDRRYLGAVVLGVPGDDDPPSVSSRRGRRDLNEVLRRGRW